MNIWRFGDLAIWRFLSGPGDPHIAISPFSHFATVFVLFVSFVLFVIPLRAAERPNILWITAEDMSADLGCYGVADAITPNLDQFAAQGVRYTRAFATIGVCAPARSTIITGMYPPSIGTQHMRCQGQLPDFVKCFSEYLRQAGYYCTNNAKTDYNFKNFRSAWDESSGKAHWRNRPRKDQPFFAVFNLGVTHESQGWEVNAEKNRQTLPPPQRRDPASITIPPYHPDTPQVRRDWANYHDNITVMDRQFADILRQLDEDGLTEDTVVFFYSDHGAGMPRSKRWLYDSSLHVPLLIRFPEKFKQLAPAAAGQTVDQLVSFVDFAPTVLSLAGVKVADHMQGVAFLGQQAGPPRQYIHGFRDRMDERYDMIRAVRDSRYKYIRNFQPHKPYFHGQYLGYANRMPTLRIWQEMSRTGDLNEVQMQWMGPGKPVEELYDTQADPWEVNNLVESPDHRSKLVELREELHRWMIGIRDLSLLPESDMRTRFGGRPEYEAVRAEPESFPVERLLRAAYRVTSDVTADPLTNRELISAYLEDADPALRWWGAMGLNALPPHQVGAERLRAHLNDSAPDVRIEIAEALVRIGHADEALPVLEAALKHENDWVRVRAANAVDNLDELARPLIEALQAAAKHPNEYVYRSAEHALEGLGVAIQPRR